MRRFNACVALRSGTGRPSVCVIRVMNLSPDIHESVTPLVLHTGHLNSDSAPVPMTAERVLIVSAPDATRSVAVRALAQRVCRVTECSGTPDARALLSVNSFELMIVAACGDGAEVTALIEQMKADQGLSDTRIIVMQLAASHCGPVRFLEAGADDVLAPDVDARELIARVRTCLSRPAARPSSAPLRVGELLLDTDRFRVVAGDSVIDISLREYQLMHFLIVNRGMVHSRERLLDCVWSDQQGISPRTVDTHVRRLRVALQQVGCEHYLQTVRGVGYRLSARIGANKTQPATHGSAQRLDGYDPAEQAAN